MTFSRLAQHLLGVDGTRIVALGTIDEALNSTLFRFCPYKLSKQRARNCFLGKTSLPAEICRYYLNAHNLDNLISGVALLIQAYPSITTICDIYTDIHTDLNRNAYPLQMVIDTNDWYVRYNATRSDIVSVKSVHAFRLASTGGRFTFRFTSKMPVLRSNSEPALLFISLNMLRCVPRQQILHNLGIR